MRQLLSQVERSHTRAQGARRCSSRQINPVINSIFLKARFASIIPELNTAGLFKPNVNPVSWNLPTESIHSSVRAVRQPSCLMFSRRWKRSLMPTFVPFSRQIRQLRPGLCSRRDPLITCESLCVSSASSSRPRRSTRGKSAMVWRPGQKPCVQKLAAG